jgi:hypothetical protein
MTILRGPTCIALAIAVLFVSPEAGGPQAGGPAASGFRAHTIATGLDGGYQVVVADLNRDGRPDVIALASELAEVRWYQNPSWEPHVLVAGIHDPINAAAFDTDGDGSPEVALAHGFSNVYAESAGLVSILTHDGDPERPWSMREIDRLPTSHRLRFADVEGTGRKVLVNGPLIGPKAAAPDYRDRVPVLIYRPGRWARETATNDEEGVVHGILPAAWGDDAGRESLLVAGFLGVHVLRFDGRQWTRTAVVDGNPEPWPRSGASEVAAGHLGRERFIATIEPWHGNQVVVYRQRRGRWVRHVIDAATADGHTLVAGDFDGDGRDELVAGERAGRRSVYLYRCMSAERDTWSKHVLDDGGMAAAGCAVADLNGDRKTDVACIGTATANLRWYENVR